MPEMQQINSEEGQISLWAGHKVSPEFKEA
jgi:hypothetical protein